MQLFLFVLAPGLLQTQAAGRAERAPSSNFSDKLGLWEGVPQRVKERSKWSMDSGVGVIIKTFSPKSLYSDNYETYEGPGEGLTYNLTLSYQLHAFDWRTERLRLQPTLEVPLMFTLVDQNTGGIVPDINLGLLLRWRDFPWNRHIYTTCGLGGGLSYSYEPWQADLDKHPGEDRSKTKFWLTYQWTFALPSHPQHQLLFFLDHQSGGWFFDDGGVEAAGIGYRHLF